MTTFRQIVWIFRIYIIKQRILGAPNPEIWKSPKLFVWANVWWVGSWMNWIDYNSDKPVTIDDMHDFSVEMDRELVRKVCRSFCKSDQLYVMVRGVYFEHLKSQAKKMLNLEDNYAICSILNKKMRNFLLFPKKNLYVQFFLGSPQIFNSWYRFINVDAFIRILWC